MKIRLLRKKKFGDDVYRLTYSLPSEKDFSREIKPGDCFVFNYNGNCRVYSLCDHDINAKEVTFHIKACGQVSKGLTKMEPGDYAEIVVVSNKGKFSLAFDAFYDICFIGAGVGISPMVYMYNSNVNPNSTLIGSIKTMSEDFIKDIVIGDINMKVTREDVTGYNYNSGRISSEDIGEHQYYFICGSNVFVDNTEKIIKEKYPNAKVIKEGCN
ncbi:MAG: hypothetical protein ACRCX2_32320 [Paraclostridium sp.]